MYLITVILIILLGDFSSATYGTSVIFHKYSELPFKFCIERYGPKFRILDPVNNLWFISSEWYLPLSSCSSYSYINNEYLYIEEVLAFSVSDSSLFVLVKGVDDNELIVNELTIRVNALYPNEGFLKDCEFVKKENMNNIEWIKLNNKDVLLALQLIWSKIFWFLSIIIIILVYPLCRNLKSSN